ncbi:hypothetical protein [Streptomyces sp. UNOC14_S4]|uniref:hypothetical protein n=1 Tax=Streptomyces sp. UNOC14_S4 TaxID=2872340 RepID=UPI001E37C31F|nr:hypothetical protein [Streptomyces sp. UNOC14_S4]MCC3766005.1 hypothetical protein [Streptomyces sp. UNOC14_S4]
MTEENIRLLMCHNCRTIEELPDHDGHPREDHLLDNLVNRHEFPDGAKHRGQLLKVPKAYWEKAHYKDEIIKKINHNLAKGGSDGLGGDFYNTKATFQDDAMACWKRHNRSLDCSDWKSDKVRLTPGTAKERKVAGLPKYRSPKDRYLCDFCPVANAVRKAHFDKTAPKD